MPLQNRRVLCVEDHEDTGFMLSNLLRHEGYEVQVVNNLGEVWRSVEGEDYDLFILDIQLPDGLISVDRCVTGIRTPRSSSMRRPRAKETRGSRIWRGRPITSKNRAWMS